MFNKLLTYLRNFFTGKLRVRWKLCVVLMDHADKATDADPYINEMVEFVAITSAKRQPRAIAQDNRVLTVKKRLQFLDAFRVHNRGAADTEELLGQPRFDGGHRLSEKMRISTTRSFTRSLACVP